MTSDPFASDPWPVPAWGYRPDNWPPSLWFTQKPTEPQQVAIENILERRELAPSARKGLVTLILARFGVPACEHESKGSASLLIDFLMNGPVRSAELELFGQEALF